MTPRPAKTATLRRVPNQPKTPLHSFRVETELWNAARDLARENDETIADVLRAALEKYVRRGKR